MKKGLFFSLLTVFSLTLLFADTVPSGYTNAVTAVESLDAYVYWDPLTGSGVLQKNGHTIRFISGESIALLDYKKLLIIDPPLVSSNSLYLSNSLLKTAEDLFTTFTGDTEFRVGAILIDPGHGGKDPGAVDTHTIDGKKVTIQEKDVALTTALELHSLLSKTYPDKKILLTRSTDTYLTLEQRVDIANSVKLEDNEAILYVSV